MPACIATLIRHPWWFGVALFCSLTCLCPAQTVTPAVPSSEFLVRTWQMEDGLPDSSVKALVQTRDGYLWVGTDNGLARFDGVNFKTFAPHTTPALGSERILCLLEDRAGGLWIGTEHGGLTRYRGGQFERVDLGPNEPKDSSILGLVEEANGQVWAWTAKQGLCSVGASASPASSPAPAQPHGPGAPAGPAGPAPAGFGVAGTTVTFCPGAFTSDSAGRAYVATTAGLAAVERGRLSPVPSGRGIIAVTRRKAGGLWFADSKWLGAWVPGEGLTAPEAQPWAGESNRIDVTCMLEDREGGLWLGSFANGLLRRSRSGVWNYVVQEGPLFQNIINCILQDGTGSIWVGTEHGGLHRLKRRVVTALPLPPSARDANAQAVWAARDGSLWIPTGGAGVFRYRDGQFTQYGRNEGFADPHVYMVLEDGRTNLWAATPAGLFRREGDRFKKEQRFGPMPGPVMCLFEDRERRLWVGALGGVACIQDDKATWFTNELAGQDVRSFAQDRTGNIWFGSAGGGLFCINNGQLRHYGPADGLVSQAIVALLADAEGTLWIGTFQEGLTRMKDGQFKTVTTQDGLANNIAGHLADDGMGNLWVSSVRGLMRISKAALNEYQPGQGRLLPCLTLTSADGMFTTPCSGGSDPAMAWDAGHRLLVANMKAVAVVDVAALAGAGSLVPGKDAVPRLAERVVIEEILVNGLPRLADSKGTVALRSGPNRLEVHYTALNFPCPELTRFRIKLEGLGDSEWIDSGFHRTANYGALPPGDYEFRVMASRRDGTWEEAAAPLALHVVPRFWESGWFRAGTGATVLAAVGLGMYAVARRRARRRLEQLERAHAMVRERARIAQDIHDELGAGLAQIGLLADLGVGEPADLQEARHNFGGIGQRARASVTALDEIVWAVNPNNDNLRRLGDYLCRMADECFESSPTRCYKEVPTDLPTVPVRAEVRHNLTLAVKEALTNTLRHAHASEVWLRLSWAAPELRIVVEDNGRGFEPAAASDHGNGLGNQRARLDKLGGAVDLESRPGQGTRITFRLQLASDGR
jgi:ligand-binding sensor domain-containing protein/signal transduction histidine kinase